MVGLGPDYGNAGPGQRKEGPGRRKVGPRRRSEEVQSGAARRGHGGMGIRRRWTAAADSRRAAAPVLADPPEAASSTADPAPALVDSSVEGSRTADPIHGVLYGGGSGPLWRRGGSTTTVGSRSNVGPDVARRQIRQGGDPGGGSSEVRWRQYWVVNGLVSGLKNGLAGRFLGFFCFF